MALRSQWLEHQKGIEITREVDRNRLLNRYQQTIAQKEDLAISQEK
jgi:hypothetical protein